MRRGSLVILLILGTATVVAAQQPVAGKDTVMKGATIEVIQAYKPQVKQAPKPEWVPQLPPPDTTHAVVNYNDVPQQSLYYTYTSMPLHPLALGREEQQLPFQNYVKLGAGNLNTLFLDAGIGGIHGSDYESYVHLHHLSQQGDITNQQTALSGIEAEGVLHKDGTDWHAEIDGERNQYHYYGYRHDLYNYTSDSVNQTYTTLRATVDLKNNGKDDVFSYHPTISASLFDAAQNTSETSIGFDVPLAYQIDEGLKAQLSINGNVASLHNGFGTANNNYVEALPGFSFENSLFHGHALLGLAAGKDKSYILPDIYAGFTLPESTCTIFAGVHSALRQNTYEQLAEENPYIYGVYPIVQTSFAEYFVGVQGGVGDHFTYSAKVSYWDYQYLPTFLNDSGDQKQFNIVYDQNVNSIAIILSGRYKVANKWIAGLSVDANPFTSTTLPYVWGEPTNYVKADIMFTPSNKFMLKAYFRSMGGIHDLNRNFETIALNASDDLGVGAEYSFGSRISVFLQLDNLFNQKYQRWYGYDSYGFNIYGGLRLKF